MQCYFRKNNSYKWSSYCNSYFKGYIQNSDNSVLREIEAIRFFLEADNYESFKEKLKKCYGLYSVVIHKNNELWCAVDIARSMPIYYSVDGNYLSDDSEFLREKINVSRDAVNPLRLLELYQTFFLAYNNTVYDCINQLSAGQCLKLSDKKLSVEYYYTHISPEENIAPNDALKLLNMHTKKMMMRLKSIVGDRTILLSLSGGHDSRYLAYSLKMHGFNNVICYTYGRNDSTEVKMAQKIALSLEYRWINVEYKDNEIKSLIEEKCTPFWEYSLQHDYTSYLQNYLSVKKIKESSIVPDNSVFITGLCNDMPTGQYIPDELSIRKYSFTNEGLVQYLFEQRFYRLKMEDEAESFFKEEIEKDLFNRNLSVTDYQSFIHAVDSVTTDYDHSRRFLKMNNAFDYFGYEWLLPCWDKDLLNFWYGININYRLKQKLYNQYLSMISKKYGNQYTTFGASYGHNKMLVSIKRILGGMLISFLYPLGIPLRRQVDINNFAPLEVMLFNTINNKKALRVKYAGLLFLLGIYTIERRYGTDWYNMISKYLKD